MYKTALSPESALVNEFNTFFEMSCPEGRKKEKWHFSNQHMMKRKIHLRFLKKVSEPHSFPQVTLSRAAAASALDSITHNTEDWGRLPTFWTFQNFSATNP